ncbi:carbohydrate-binding module family 48 protein [Linnemannia elongata AG-77]|uniref:Carbohydrate-binding module family 48 protein n=1 Tax=Linnemannia elongata AG-77 TaxID=1314771 RepID=A0A197KDE4_9FUNG|nr:carbohydrate-binding module family 48 protein [Linnemannia elongata AG-77]
MPATPKAAVIGNGQKIATVTPAASPAGSVDRPSPSSAGMSTPAEVPSTPLSKNQKKKRSKAAKTAASAATSPAAPIAATTESSPSTPVANVKQQQETSTSTKQQITPTVELLGLSEEKKTLAEGASPIARNILDTASTPAALPQPPKRAFVAHTFQWKNGGGVVKITGTFDNWGESIVLKKVRGNQDQSEIVIDLDRSQKTLFKFVVDGQWKCTDEYPTEYDSIGNLNNVLPALNA